MIAASAYCVLRAQLASSISRAKGSQKAGGIGKMRLGFLGRRGDVSGRKLLNRVLTFLVGSMLRWRKLFLT